MRAVRGHVAGGREPQVESHVYLHHAWCLLHHAWCIVYRNLMWRRKMGDSREALPEELKCIGSSAKFQVHRV